MATPTEPMTIEECMPTPEEWLRIAISCIQMAKTIEEISEDEAFLVAPCADDMAVVRRALRIATLDTSLMR